MRNQLPAAKFTRIRAEKKKIPTKVVSIGRAPLFYTYVNLWGRDVPTGIGWRYGGIHPSRLQILAAAAIDIRTILGPIRVISAFR